MRIDPGAPLPTTAERTPTVESVLPAKARQDGRFEAVLGKRAVSARRSLRADIEQSGIVEGMTAELFGSRRSMEILEYVLDNVIPGLDADPEIKALAHELICEEIALRRLLEEQRAQVVES
ncbi:hypothetical protein [Pseudomonas fluorescens]|uniref:Uncharacterized protein n=1 Tax=Pseudomonas fluorescens TaxID=294 RepID=A0A944HAY0_PSEFL|nr:hypothetical protein [Pseudomonas fluorescens]MBT2297567.1 hypothetical protein [Pseudomonas fluorescens]MBT2305765.1 hypothetical protein [Pseudomonas fluorescens]MBT2314212.1 hypothetical protein [Pseudomonas fluorescens]MBT2319296.1 hypothetical protein [Pseudomonas fluorescens]MBT2327506.1 hypothetical protein [Pseudomonas fluorescens]